MDVVCVGLATLDTILEAARQAQVEPPATLVVGQTVALAEHLHWYSPGEQV
jgi:siroheme synthase